MKDLNEKSHLLRQHFRIPHQCIDSFDGAKIRIISETSKKKRRNLSFSLKIFHFR